LESNHSISSEDLEWNRQEHVNVVRSAAKSF